MNKKRIDKKPTIILVGAQLGENIGMVARAMLNFGLTDLRLVRPRADWHKAKAYRASAGAEAVIDSHRQFDTVAEAIADLGYVVAMTARPRDMVKPVLTLPAAAQTVRDREAKNIASGVLFGAERSGLDNDDISLADIICSVPLNPAFSSLNLAQAVLLVAYAWFQLSDTTPTHQLPMADTRTAERAEITALFAHLEAALDAAGFLSPPEKRPAMVRNLRNMFHRAALTEQDVRTFRGVINALLRWPRQAETPAIRTRVADISRGKKVADDAPE